MMCPRAATRPETQVKRQEERRWLTPSGRDAEWLRDRQLPGQSQP